MNLLNAYNFKNMDYAVLFVDGNLKEFQTREEMMQIWCQDQMEPSSYLW